MTTKCIFHKGDKVQFLPIAGKRCAMRIQVLVDELSELPALTVATSIDHNDGYIKIQEDGRTYSWPVEWFELLNQFKPVPIDDLL